MSRSKRSVVIAASDRLFADAAAAYVGRQDGWQVVGTAMDGLHALAAITRLQPSCVLVMGELSRLGTPALTSRIRSRSPDTTVVVLGNAEAPGAQILEPSAGAADVLTALAAAAIPIAQPAARGGPTDIDRLQNLTPRERRTLKLLAEGYTRDEIASRFDVSTHTVRTHVQNLYAKLGVHSRSELVHFAARHGLVGGD